MKISIITSTYNSEEHLEEALNSYQMQSYLNKELIVIDGDSKDNTVAILAQKGKLVNRFVSEKDKGIYDALNKGIKFSSGEIIGVLHSDDMFYDEEVLTIVAEKFASDSSLDAVYGDLLYVDRKQSGNVIRNWVSGRYNKKKLAYGWMPPHPALFIKKECFLKYGLYDLNYKSAADYDLILRFLYANAIKTDYIPKVFSKMRVGGISNQSLKNRIRANKEDRVAMKSNGIQFPLLASILKPLQKLTQYF